MTNIRVMDSCICTKDQEGHRHFEWKVNDDKTKARKKRDPITDEEVQLMIKKADLISNSYPNFNTYFQLRAKAIIALARIFGKRRSEIASLEMINIRLREDVLEIIFVLRKKRKRGLFQYMDYCKEHDQTILKLPLPEIKIKWIEWQATDAGHKLKEIEAKKVTDKNSFYAQTIIKYWNYVKQNYPSSKYLFPAGKAMFDNYQLYQNKHLEGDRLFRIVKQLDPDLWMHLFREMVGGETAKASGRSIESVYAVKRKLNLEREETAWRYIERSIPDKMDV